MVEPDLDEYIFHVKDYKPRRDDNHRPSSRTLYRNHLETLRAPTPIGVHGILLRCRILLGEPIRSPGVMRESAGD